MNVNKLKYLLALLFVSFSTLASMAQEYEKQEIKILDFKQVNSFLIDYAKEFAYQESNRDSTIWALLIVETNDPNIRVISSEGNPGYYVWEELRKNPRFNINEHRMPGEIWYSLRPGAKQFRVAHSLYRHDTDIPALYNREGKHIGRIISNWYIPPAKMLGEYGLVEAGKTYRLKIEVPQYNPGPVEEKKQEMGWVVIDSDPQGAKVFSVKDGVETLMDMPTPYTEKVPYGRYFYRISKNLYHDETVEVVVNEAKVSKMVKLRPDFGSIDITSTPAGAEVSLSYPLSQTYTTPCRIDNIPSGTYTLALMKAAHTPYEQTVTVIGGEVTQVNAVLDSRLAHVTINSLPGAVITINGENKGTTSFSGDLVANTYDIEATLVGHEKATKQITVVAKQPQTIELNPTPMYGILDIMSTPYNASVTVDGKVAGTTPLTLDKLLVGTHTVKITLDGYEEVTKTVTIAKDSEETLNLQLTKIVAPSVASPVSPGYNQVDRRDNPKMSVISFEEAKNDKTAILHGTMRTYNDSKGEKKAALIKVETTEYGFRFDTGSIASLVGEVEPQNKNHPAEIWVYVMDGVKKITIQHSVHGVIRDYDLGRRLKGGRTYILKLNVTSDQRTKGFEIDYTNIQYLQMNIFPTNAEFYISGVRQTLDAYGRCEIPLPFGKYSYRITAPNYHSEEGTLSVVDAEPQTISIILRPASGLTPRWSSSATAEQKRIIGELIESMVMVEGGTFTMGATSEQGGDAESDEKPTHRVTLSDYYIGAYEVTQEQWQAVMGNNPSNFNGSRKPVESVSYNDIVEEFLPRLERLTGLKFVLPTEAQWEYAARGGNKSRGYKYSGSNDINSVAWYTSNSGSETHPVGQKQPNELGLYDMIGNVYEWCHDWYGSSYYASSPSTNPEGPDRGSIRVLRGGSWCHKARLCRVSYRRSNDPGRRYDFYGLRLALQF